MVGGNGRDEEVSHPDGRTGADGRDDRHRQSEFLGSLPEITDALLENGLTQVYLLDPDFQGRLRSIMVTVGMRVEDGPRTDACRKHILGGRRKINQEIVVYQDTAQPAVFPPVVRAVPVSGTGTEEADQDSVLLHGVLLVFAFRCGEAGGCQRSLRGKAGGSDRRRAEECASVHHLISILARASHQEIPRSFLIVS